MSKEMIGLVDQQHPSVRDECNPLGMDNSHRAPGTLFPVGRVKNQPSSDLTRMCHSSGRKGGTCVCEDDGAVGEAIVGAFGDVGGIFFTLCVWER